MQQRLVGMLTNPDLLAVNSYYSQQEKFAGGRIWSGFPGKEIWGKPLSPGTAAVVLLNRGGLASGNRVNGPASNDGLDGCFDMHGHSDAILAPCDDNITASKGAQVIALNLSAIPRAWLGLSLQDGAGGGGAVTCEVFDILATAKVGASLGRHAGSAFAPVVPPHGVRFVRVSNYTAAAAE